MNCEGLPLHITTKMIIMAAAVSSSSTTCTIALKPLTSICSSTNGFNYIRNPNPVSSSISNFILINNNRKQQPPPPLIFKSLAKLTESDSPNSLQSPDPTFLIQDLVDSFKLPEDYFKQLPNDLRLDLNDAAFDLSSGPVIDECGQDLGETLLNITRAWEAADTSTSATLVSKLPKLVVSASANNNSAFGKRLVSSGRRFQSMGQYGNGELQKIAKAMIAAGKLLSSSPVSNAAVEEPAQGTRMFKFGELQVALTPNKAYVGALIAFVFGTLSWELSQGVQSIPESSLQYANDNALLLAKSLRGALLAVCYTSTVLSAFATGGLVLLAGQLKSEQK